MRSSQVIIYAMLLTSMFYGQEINTVNWIRPNHDTDAPVWGIKGGIVLALWPAAVENTAKENIGGPRGLFRMGYERNGQVYLINFIAVEPVVDDKMEFSEISPSLVDNKWGKLMWAGADEKMSYYLPRANTRGVISHPVQGDNTIEELTFFIYMEKFQNGAHPYLKVSLRSDRPDEIGFQIFHHKNSAKMERCALTATMGNYTRARRLYLKNKVIKSEEIYADYDDIHFIEKEEYPVSQMMTDEQGNPIVVIDTNESFDTLSSWPSTLDYQTRSSWRYRPSFSVTQYWRKGEKYDESLRVRVNGRRYYWAGGSKSRKDYIAIPGGPAFENFEIREKYYPGQQFYYGISTGNISDILSINP